MATTFETSIQAPGTIHGDSGGLGVSAREFLRNPTLVGSAFPASRHLVDALLDPVDWSTTRVVLEYGPGSGPLSRAMLTRMRRDSRLITIDVSDRFTQHLRRTIEDPRLSAITDSAASVAAILEREGVGPADLIVTGIPFSTMSPEEGGSILDASARVLRDSGLLAAYQMRSTVAPMLEERFGKIRRSYVWRNIPPCHLLWASHAAQRATPQGVAASYGDTAKKRNGAGTSKICKED